VHHMTAISFDIDTRIKKNLEVIKKWQVGEYEKTTTQ